MFLEKCWYKAVPSQSCPSDPNSLKQCTVPTTKGELCEASKPWPCKTENIDNCGYDDVYSADCIGTNLVSNPYMT